MKESDWDLFLERLVKVTKESITTFATEHPKEEVCYFAYDSEPRYGYVLTSYNTTRASLNRARKSHDHDVSRRRKLLKNPAWFDNAYYQARVNSVTPFCNNTGDFAYQRYRTIQFPEWQQFAESGRYVEQDDPDDDYLLNRAARLFCRAIDRLVDGKAFNRLRLATPTLLGFGFHDHDQYVMRMLNLPKAMRSRKI